MASCGTKLLTLVSAQNHTSKFSESKLIGLLEFALPTKWRKLMDLKGFVLADND
jgi:hypothetical protein